MAVSELGKRIKFYRKRAGLTQEQLAEVAGVSRPVIANLERGTRSDAWFSSISALAIGLNIPLDFLVARPYEQGACNAESHAQG